MRSGCGILIMGTVSWGCAHEPWFLAEQHQCQRDAMTLHEAGLPREGQ